MILRVFLSGRSVRRRSGLFRFVRICSGLFGGDPAWMVVPVARGGWVPACAGMTERGAGMTEETRACSGFLIGRILGDPMGCSYLVGAFGGVRICSGLFGFVQGCSGCDRGGWLCLRRGAGWWVGRWALSRTFVLLGMVARLGGVGGRVGSCLRRNDDGGRGEGGGDAGRRKCERTLVAARGVSPPT